MLTAVFDRIAGRVQKRQNSARERIEDAAKRIAAGESIDEAGVEGALFEAGLTVEAFRDLAVFYQERRQRLDRLNTLGAARKRLEKADQAIDAENRRHAEATEQYRKRFLSLRQEADAAGAEVAAARDARDWLLDVQHCPPSLRDQYQAALDAEQAATVAVGDAEREARRLRERIASEAGFIDQLTGEASREIAPPELVMTPPGRQRMAAATQAKVDEHEKQKTRLERRLVEAEAAVAEARKSLAAAEATLADLRKRILAA